MLKHDSGKACGIVGRSQVVAAFIESEILDHVTPPSHDIQTHIERRSTLYDRYGGFEVLLAASKQLADASQVTHSEFQGRSRHLDQALKKATLCRRIRNRTP